MIGTLTLERRTRTRIEQRDKDDVRSLEASQTPT